MTRKMVATLAIGAVIGVGVAAHHHDAPLPATLQLPSHQSEPTGEPFLPAYLAMLQGKQPLPQNVCHPQTLAEMLIPCDTP